jgi:hypothetical protein
VAAAALAALVALSGAACRGGSDDAPPFDLESGRAREPHDEGVATKITVNEVTLDGTRTYPVHRQIQSFSTYDRALQPLVGFENLYVQLGLDKGGKVVWLAGIAAVVPGDPPTVFYSGTPTGVSGTKMSFADGTVLQIPPGMTVPEGPARVRQVRIDARTHRVVSVQ